MLKCIYLFPKSIIKIFDYIIAYLLEINLSNEDFYFFFFINRVTVKLTKKEFLRMTEKNELSAYFSF